MHPWVCGGVPHRLLHGLAATTGFLAFVVATLLLWRRMRSEPGRTRYATFSALAGIFTLVFLAAWFVGGAADPEQFHAGALQRLFVGAVLAWLCVTGLRLLQLAPDRPGAEAPRW